MDTKGTKLLKILDLTYRTLQGQVTQEEFEELETMLAEDPEARVYYLEFMSNHITMNRLDFAFARKPLPVKEEGDDTFRKILEKDLSETAIRRAMVEGGEEPAEAVKFGRSGGRRRGVPSMRKLKMFAFRAAAIIGLCLLVLWLDRWAVRENSRVVARLIEQTDVRWDVNRRMPGRDGLMGRESYRLLEGMARLQFENGARVVFTGPVTFNLESGKRIYLHEGKLVAHIVERAVGFEVAMPGATVIDLGTEFGARVDKNGDCEVGVFKGKVSLVPGGGGRGTKDVVIRESQVKHVCYQTARVSNVSINQSAFAQEFQSPYERAARRLGPAAYWRADVALDNGFANVCGAGGLSSYLGDIALVDGPLLGDEKIANAVYFYGRDESHIRIDQMDQIRQSRTGFTVSLWVRPESFAAIEDGAGTASRLTRYYMLLGEGLYGHLTLNSNGELEHYFCKGVREADSELPYEPFSVNGGATEIQPRQWYHVAVTLDYNTKLKRLFINGVEAGPAVEVEATFETSCEQLYLGTVFARGRGFSRTRYERSFHGAMAEVALFDYPLSETAIRELYGAVRN